VSDGAIKRIEENTRSTEPGDSAASSTAADGTQPTAVAPKNTNASANNCNVDNSNGSATSKLPQAGSQNQHVRPIKDKEVKTCIKV